MIRRLIISIVLSLGAWCGGTLRPAFALASPSYTPALRTPGLTCKAFDAQGREIYRSRARRDRFRRMSGYPNGRPGYEVDHVVPLCAGGCDLPSAMQWLTIEDHAAKSRWDAAYCAGRTALSWTQWLASERCSPGPNSHPGGGW